MTRRLIARITSKALATAAVAALLLLVGAPPARAYDSYRDKCRQRVEKAELRLDKEVREHGLYSHQAEARRRDLRNERARCWQREHAWWDGRSQSWHDNRDWDNDSSRDYDRDHH